MSAKPLPPTALRAHVLADGRVRLIWNHSESPDVAEYRIYVGRSDGIFYDKPLAVIKIPSRDGHGAGKTWDSRHWDTPSPFPWEWEESVTHAPLRINKAAHEKHKPRTPLEEISLVARARFVVRAVNRDGVEDDNTRAVAPRPFRHYDSLSSVYCLLQTDDGRVWLGTSGGIQVYRGLEEGLSNAAPRVGNGAPPEHTYTVDDGLGDNEVQCLPQDRDGRVWAGHVRRRGRCVVMSEPASEQVN